MQVQGSKDEPMQSMQDHHTAWFPVPDYCA